MAHGAPPFVCLVPVSAPKIPARRDRAAANHMVTLTYAMHDVSAPPRS